ncbi:hypothetical protein CBR_g54661 [Chara braunii]|uniref:Uncharacterized protein n=1 Tax=Chara braunii TaxID=69332 RepID=A0A388MCI8_CHABU|nr:hypothetical protein CBR_g54661 [Chara braunii]|eukprot:GBG92215.1 hypothetical protein CBR_g54661 [Chara braunii]
MTLSRRRDEEGGNKENETKDGTSTSTEHASKSNALITRMQITLKETSDQIHVLEEKFESSKEFARATREKVNQLERNWNEEVVQFRTMYGQKWKSYRKKWIKKDLEAREEERKKLHEERMKEVGEKLKTVKEKMEELKAKEREIEKREAEVRKGLGKGAGKGTEGEREGEEKGEVMKMLADKMKNLEKLIMHVMAVEKEKGKKIKKKEKRRQENIKEREMEEKAMEETATVEEKVLLGGKGNENLGGDSTAEEEREPKRQKSNRDLRRERWINNMFCWYCKSQGHAAPRHCAALREDEEKGYVWHEEGLNNHVLYFDWMGKKILRVAGKASAKFCTIASVVQVCFQVGEHSTVFHCRSLDRSVLGRTVMDGIFEEDEIGACSLCASISKVVRWATAGGDKICSCWLHALSGGECNLGDGHSVGRVGRKTSDALGDLAVENGAVESVNHMARLHWRSCFQIPVRDEEEGGGYKERGAVREEAMKEVVRGALNPPSAEDRKPVIVILRLMDRKFYEELEETEVSDKHIVGWRENVERGTSDNIKRRMAALNRSNENEMGLHATVCVGLAGGIDCGNEYVILSEHRNIGRVGGDVGGHRLIAMNLEEFVIRTCEIWEPVVSSKLNFVEPHYILLPISSEMGGATPSIVGEEHEGRRVRNRVNPSAIGSRGREEDNEGRRGEDN